MGATSHSGKRILLIDDDYVTGESMSFILAADGYRVAVARNGAEALQKLHDCERPEVILLDLRMPVMDGGTCCKQWRQNPEFTTIPIVVISGLADAAEQAAKLGAVTCLAKPIDTITLLTTLRECCEGTAMLVPGKA